MSSHHSYIYHPDETPERIRYPRRSFLRWLAKVIGYLFLPIFFRVKVNGKGNFPKGGPLLVVGNHAAVMEAALMVVYTPWLVELIGGVDVPHDSLTALAVKFYRFIPIHRGAPDRSALRSALSVLQQQGVIGIFPQGGIWQTSEQSAQSGVAWLSEKSQAPVLPMYFGGVTGALGKALQFKRPALTMTVGKLIPALEIHPGEDRKAALADYSEQVMRAIDGLCPPEERALRPQIRDEMFELVVEVRDAQGIPLATEQLPAIPHGSALSQMLHTPVILDIFSTNLHLPVEALKDIKNQPPAAEIAKACTVVLDYLAAGNPYLLTYRFGPRRGTEMQLGVQELRAIAEAAASAGYTLHVTAIHRYFDLKTGQTVEKTELAVFNRWQ